MKLTGFPDRRLVLTGLAADDGPTGAKDEWNESDHPRAPDGRFFHGTSSDFTEFKASESGSWGSGVYMTDDRPTAEKWAPSGTGKVLSVSVSHPVLDLRKDVPASVTDAFKNTLDEEQKETFDYYVDDKGYSPAETMGLFAQTIPNGTTTLRTVLQNAGYGGLTAKLLAGAETVVYNPAHARIEKDAQ